MLKDDTVLVLSPCPLFANGKLSVSELTVSFLTRLSRPLIKQWGALGACWKCVLQGWRRDAAEWFGSGHEKQSNRCGQVNENPDELRRLANDRLRYLTDNLNIDHSRECHNRYPVFYKT